MARDQLLPVFTDTAGHQRVYKKKWRIEYASSSVAGDYLHVFQFY